MHSREAHLSNWVTHLFPQKTLSIQPLVGDASFRRYHRCYYPDGTYIIMDVPPDKESDCLMPFLFIGRALEAQGIKVPHIHHSHLEEGFMLLDDFGDVTYLEAFKTENPHSLYQKAIQTLLKIQQCKEIPDYTLPFFDANFMMMELERFDDWFVHQLLELSLKRSEQKILNDTYEHLIQSAMSQPQVLIHRDYHSRNLMLTQTNSPGVLDFQDAMIGPITYDLVSLLKDCYIHWPESFIQVYVNDYFNQAIKKNLINEPMTETQFTHAFDLMGMQRHFKVAGIFSRLHLRDHKSAYLKDIPCAMRYLLQTSGLYEEFEELHWLLQTIIWPKFLFPQSLPFRHKMLPRTTVAAL